MTEHETAGIPERYRHWDERKGLVLAGHLTMRDAGLALRRSLPTMEHAVRLVDEVAARTMTIQFTPPPTAVEWPADGAAVPAALVPLPPPPEEIPPAFREAGFSRWVPLLGGFGHVRYALLRDEETGFTLIGDGILDLIDPAAVTAEMDASDAEEQAWRADIPEDVMPNIWTEPTYPVRFLMYGCWDDGHQKRIPLKQAGGSFGAAWSPQSIDGDVARWQVMRLSRRSSG